MIWRSVITVFFLAELTQRLLMGVFHSSLFRPRRLLSCYSLPRRCDCNFRFPLFCTRQSRGAVSDVFKRGLAAAVGSSVAMRRVVAASARTSSASHIRSRGEPAKEYLFQASVDVTYLTRSDRRCLTAACGHDQTSLLTRSKTRAKSRSRANGGVASNGGPIGLARHLVSC